MGNRKKMGRKCVFPISKLSTQPGKNRSPEGESSTVPEHYPQYVGDEQCEADVQREAFSVLRLLDGEVLRNIRHHTADNHGYSRSRRAFGENVGKITN